jgi:anti-sigma factor RsiW
MLHAYADGELDLVKTLDVERHIASCAGCAAVHRGIVALRSAVGDGSLYYRAPADLEGRIRASLPKPPSAARVIRIRNWMSAAAAIVLVATMGWLVMRRGGEDRERLLAGEVTSAHVRSLMADHLWDVKSTDRHTVKPWFDGKLDFAPDVRDFAQASFPLDGGRLDYVGGRAVAALVYRHDKHYINLFVWPAPGQADRGEEETSHQGYVMLHWVRGGMQYWVISDTSAETLRQFAAMVREGGAAATMPTR